MVDRLCLVTGANRGIGWATALGLARRGATVVMLCRDAERCARACEEVRRQSGNPNVSGVTIDLASLTSIRAAAAELARRYPAVHVLVNNAGVNLARPALSPDGIERTFAVNHLGPFLLTNLLLPLLRAGAPARVVSVTSWFERFGRIDFAALRTRQVVPPRRYGALRAYTSSKLANVLFTYELAEQLAGTGVTANCVHPGLVATDLMRDWPRWMRRLWDRFLLTPEEGARPVIWLAAAPEAGGITGRCFGPARTGARQIRSSPRSYDVAARRRLWQVSEELTGIAAISGPAKTPQRPERHHG
jgi:retinol dehydrogenase-14